MPKLYVIRHAQVNVDFGVPAPEWQLSAEGAEAARALALRETWEDVACIYHSPEAKAAATARIVSEVAGVPTKLRDGLHELPVPIITPHEEFIRRVGAYLAGFSDPDFEPWHIATERIIGCVRDIVAEVQDTAAHYGGADSNAQASGRTGLTKRDSVAIVSHGRILSVFYSYLLHRRLTVQEWQSIRFPDLSVIDLDTWTVERGFLSNARSEHGREL